QSMIPIVGGTFTPQDESGDARKFVQMLEKHCIERGVVFRYGCTVKALSSDGCAITGVQLSEGECVRADAYVVALGSFSSPMLRPLGVRLSVFPAKGYSVTIPLDSEMENAPIVSLTDDEVRLVFSRLGNRLRVAGMAEFMGYDTTLDAARCKTLMRRIIALFPSLEGRPVDFWAGLRPSTPGNVPLVGPARYDNLWINTGHGTLGWTMACGSGKLLADLLSGRASAIDPGPYQHR
ncbi:MAG: FAD-dependent oxidoreductase, partial [Rhodocyclaceae bacterium]|nr:FAD-dependent oxidoreductase [Rhodocyclaceae bacterium]